MALVKLCDWREGKEPCGERADDGATAKLDWDNKTWVVDLCQVHMKALTSVAREAESPPSPPPTYLPRAEPKKANKGRTAALREWAAQQNPPIELSKGRQKEEHIAAFEKATGQSYWG